MAYEQKPGDIAVFMERSKKSDKAPDWKGSMVAHRDIRAGEKLDVAFWSKSDTMLAGKVQDQRQRTEQKPAPSGGRPRGNDLDDDVGF